MLSALLILLLAAEPKPTIPDGQIVTGRIIGVPSIAIKQLLGSISLDGG